MFVARQRRPSPGHAAIPMVHTTRADHIAGAAFDRRAQVRLQLLEGFEQESHDRAGDQAPTMPVWRSIGTLRVSSATV